MERTDVLNTEHFQTLRSKGDELGDHLFMGFKANPALTKSFYQLQSNRDLVEFSQKSSLFKQLQFEIPERVNPEKVRKGQLFFQQYQFEILGMLGFYSLPFCYAASSGSRVLYYSERLRKEPQKRLLETAYFVFDCCALDAFELDGSGFLSSLKVRVMHAAARHYVRDKILDEEPVNQEDLLGTLIAFSLISIRGLRRIGITISTEQAEDFLSLWTFIGSQLGIDQTLLPQSIQEASTVERIIRKHQFSFSEHNQVLLEALIASMEDNSEAPKVDIRSMMVYLLGEEVARCVGLQESKTKSQFFGQAARIRNFFKDFSKGYPQAERFLRNELNRQNLKPDFRISF